MKKVAVAVIAVTLTAVAVFWAAGRKESVTAEGYCISEQDAVRTIRCRGLIEAGEQKTVSATAACVIDEVYIQTGETVKKGEKLFSIDTKKTRDALFSVGKISEREYTALAASPVVCAPFDGIVIKMNFNEGEIADPSRNGIVLADTATLQVAVKVPEMRIKDVYIGQSAEICGECFRKSSYAGTVTFLSAAAGTVLGKGTMLDATVTLADGEADESLRLGLTAEVEMPAEVFHQCLLIPYDCLQNDGSDYYVLVEEAGVANKTIVSIAAELRDGAVIGEGVQPGETVLRNAAKYTDGQAVRVK